MRKEQVLGKYSANGKQCIVNGFDVYTDDYTEQEYQRYYDMVSDKVLINDYIDLIRENRLIQLLVDGTIDRPLYKALMLVKTYKVNDYDIRFRRYTTNDMRYRAVRNNFKLYYQRSRVKLSFNFLKRLLSLLKARTQINIHNINDNKLLSRKYKILYKV